MAYSKQLFSLNQVLTYTEMNQLETNIQDHYHGVSGSVTASMANITHTGSLLVVGAMCTSGPILKNGHDVGFGGGRYAQWSTSAGSPQLLNVSSGNLVYAELLSVDHDPEAWMDVSSHILINVPNDASLIRLTAYARIGLVTAGTMVAMSNNLSGISHAFAVNSGMANYWAALNGPMYTYTDIIAVSSGDSLKFEYIADSNCYIYERGLTMEVLA